jgi:hypothetical protein
MLCCVGHLLRFQTIIYKKNNVVTNQEHAEICEVHLFSHGVSFTRALSNLLVRLSF